MLLIGCMDGFLQWLRECALRLDPTQKHGLNAWMLSLVSLLWKWCEALSVSKHSLPWLSSPQRPAQNRQHWLCCPDACLRRTQSRAVDARNCWDLLEGAAQECRWRQPALGLDTSHPASIECLQVRAIMRHPHDIVHYICSIASHAE